jgi:hypothetical protein
MNMPTRAIVAMLLVVGTLGFGAVGLCGAVFTFVMLPNAVLSAPGGMVGTLGLLAISVPSLLIGGWLARWCVRRLKALREQRSE